MFKREIKDKNTLAAYNSRAATSPTNRLYAIEFLRIIFISGIVFFHIIVQCPALRDSYLNFFHTSSHHLSFGVECFFIIGGFFLVRNLLRTPEKQTAFRRIQKLWWRLAPGLIFVFLILSFTNKGVSWRHFPVCLYLIPGTGLAPGITGWGDYFIGTYFLISCLLIGLFTYQKNSAWLILSVTCYMLISLQTHIKPTLPRVEVGGIYFNLIANGMVRGLTCMGLGAIGAFLSENLRLERRTCTRMVATGYEGLALFILFGYLTSADNFRFTPLEMELSLSFLLVSIVHNLGYISSLLNRMNWIMYFSRYTYSFLLGHIVVIRWLLFPEGKYTEGLSLSQALLVVVGGGLLGIIEYHLIERFLVPKIRAYLSQDQGAKINGGANL